MKHRKLRIAWSVAWGIIAVLSIVLWACSFFDGGEIVHENLSASPKYGVSALILSSSRGAAALHIATGNKYWLAIPQFRLPGITCTHSQPFVVFIYLSYCLPTLSSALLAAVPWLRWSSRFSLRTLLIATTLIAIGLGLIVCLSQLSSF